VLGDTCIALLRRIVLNTNGLLLLVKVTPIVHGSSVFLAVREPVIPCQLLPLYWPSIAHVWDLNIRWDWR
jgi:hypothetical protein